MPAPDRKIRVMALAPTLGQGGAERVLSLLLEHLDRDRFIPELGIFEPGSIAYAVPEDVPIHVLAERPAPRLGHTIPVSAELALRFPDTIAWLSGTAAKLAELVREREPDVVIASPLWACVMVSIAAPGFPDKTVAVHRIDAPPSVPLAEYPWRDLFAYFISENFSRRAEIVAVSGGAADDLAENFGIERSRIRVIHNPATIDRIQSMAQEPAADWLFSDDEPIVLFVGRLEHVKGLEYLFRAMARLTPGAPFHLALVGEGSQRGYLAALAKHLGIDGSVHFLGRQDNPFSLMSKATMLVLPSLSEGMSNVLVEAMVCGCPIVATDIEGGITRELLRDGACGLIVPRADETALSDAIATLLGDSAMRERFAEEGRRRAQDFALDIIMGEYEAALLAALERRSDEPSSKGGPISASGAAGVSPGQTAASAVVFGRRALRFVLRKARGVAVRVAGRVKSVLGSSTVSIPENLSVRANVGGGLVMFLPSMSDQTLAPQTTMLARHMAERGRAVTVVTLNHTALGDRVLGVEYVSLDGVAARPGVPVSAMVAVPTPGREGDAEWLAITADKLARVARLAGADAVLAEGWEAGRLALMAKRSDQPGPAVVLRLHSRVRDVVAGSGVGLDADLIAKHMGSADRVVVPRDEVADELAVSFPELSARTTVMPDSIDIGGVPLVAGQGVIHEWLLESIPVFMCVGLAQEDPGTKALLEAFRLASQRVRLRLLLVAEGPRTSGFVRLIASSEVPKGDVAVIAGSARECGVLSGAQAVVHAGGPCVGVPQDVVGAMAQGCAVISTRCSDAVGALLGEGRYGLLVRHGDAQGLAEAMLQLMWDDDARAGMATCGPARLDALGAVGAAARLDALVAEIATEDTSEIS